MSIDLNLEPPPSERPSVEEAADPDRTDGAASGSDRWAVGAMVAALVVAALTLWREAETEPFHIDELRQVRPYGEGLDVLIDASYAQEQPPLDVIVGSLFRGALGVGDVLQRSHSMVAGMLALGLLGLLLRRSGSRFGAAAAVFTLALMPGFVSFTAYARPYALPLALMLGYLFTAEIWLDRASRFCGALLGLIALLLPLSRVFEPPAFLALSALTVAWYGRQRPEWARRWWLVVATSGLSLVAVELPVYRRLQAQLTAYQGDDPASFADQVQRIVDDSIPRLAEVFVHGWLALAIVAVAASLPEFRRRLVAIWWFWPLIGTAAAFGLAFHIRTQPDQPFFDRYGYFWLPAFAVVVALLVDVSVLEWSRRRFSARSAAAMLTAFACLAALGLREDFASPAHSDYRSLGNIVEQRLPSSTPVVFDTITVPLGEYRPGYAGWGRYTARERLMLKAEQIPSAPDRIGEDRPYAIATAGPTLDVPGWTAVPATPSMTLYLPTSERSGRSDLAQDLLSFADQLPVANGAVLRLAGIALMFDLGLHSQACDETALLIAAEPAIAADVREKLSNSAVAGAFADCQV